MQTKFPAGKLYGKNLKTRQIEGLRLAEVSYPAGVVGAVRRKLKARN
jgi:hypothetical protein